jgi:hypothetical protein
MLFRETAAVYCENHTEHTNTLCGQNAGIWYVKGRALEAAAFEVWNAFLAQFLYFEKKGGVMRSPSVCASAYPSP